MRKLRFAFEIISILLILVLLAGARVEYAQWINADAAEVYAQEFRWYYLPHAQNKQPRPMEKAKFYEKYSVLYVGVPDEKIIYLTFDDCPENDNILAILDVLEKHQAPAAFFMTKPFIENHPDTVRRVLESGSLVCNHTSRHVNVAQLSFEKFKTELKGVEEAYFEVTGLQLPKYFRPPHGAFSEASLRYADEMGYTTVFWSFCYRDWDTRQPSKGNALSAIIKEAHPGEIMLLHCQSSTNLQILDQALTSLSELGYGFGSLEDIQLPPHTLAP